MKRLQSKSIEKFILMNKRVFIKIVIINLLIFIILIVISEILLFNLEKKNFSKEIIAGAKAAKTINEEVPIDASYHFIMHNFNYNNDKIRKMRPVERKGNKHNIILFGCSFTYGSWLNSHQTFSYKLAEQTQSTVFNRGVGGWGLQHILYQLKRKDFYAEVNPPDYVIYTFMDDHVRRLNQHQAYSIFENSIMLRYKEKNNEFVEIRPFLLPFWILYSVKESQRWLERDLIKNKNEACFITFVKMLKECKRILNCHYPNAKFVVLTYSDNFYNNPIHKKLWNDLKKDGFILVDVSELMGHNTMNKGYRLTDNHPSSKAWDEIVPALVKKLNL